MINLISWMIKKPKWFTVKERNRVRRNLEVFKPRTIRKDGSPGVLEVYKHVTSFLDPKPYNILKEFKVFEWKHVEGMMLEMAKRYEIVRDPVAEGVVGAGDKLGDVGEEANRILPEEGAGAEARMQATMNGVDGDMCAPEESESHWRPRIIQSQHDALQNLDTPQPGHPCQPCQPAEPFIPVQSQALVAQPQPGNLQVSNFFNGPHLQQGHTLYYGQGEDFSQLQQPFNPVQAQVLATQTQMGNLHVPNQLSGLQQPHQEHIYHHGQGTHSYQIQQQLVDAQTQALMDQTQMGDIQVPNLFSGPQPQQGELYHHGHGPHHYQTQLQPIDTQTQALMDQTRMRNIQTPNLFSGPPPQQGHTYYHGQGPLPYKTQQQPLDEPSQALLAQIQLTRLQPNPLSLLQPQQGQNHQFAQGQYPMPSTGRFPELQGSQPMDSEMAQNWLSGAFQNPGPVLASPNRFLTPMNASAQPNMDILEEDAPFPESSDEILGISQNMALDDDVFLNTWSTEHERSSTAMTDGNIVDHDAWIREMLDETLHTPPDITGGGLSSTGMEVDRSDGNRSDSAETWRDDTQNPPDPPQN
jgi:hypothetical protein